MAALELECRPLLAISGSDGTLSIWDVAQGALFGRWMVTAGVPVTALAALAALELEGRPLLVSGDARGAVQVWDLVAGGSLRRRPGMKDPFRPWQFPTSTGTPSCPPAATTERCGCGT